jgi:hypothetical protein
MRKRRRRQAGGSGRRRRRQRGSNSRRRGTLLLLQQPQPIHQLPRLTHLQLPQPLQMPLWMAGQKRRRRRRRRRRWRRRASALLWQLLLLLGQAPSVQAATLLRCSNNQRSLCLRKAGDRSWSS